MTELLAHPLVDPKVRSFNLREGRSFLTGKIARKQDNLNLPASVTIKNYTTYVSYEIDH